MIWALMCFARNTQAPGAGWRITTISTFMERILRTVSISVSPFETEEDDAEKLMTSALRRFCASSNEMRVRVEFSKKILAMVMSRRDGTFLMGRLMMVLKLSVVSKTSSMSRKL